MRLMLQLALTNPAQDVKQSSLKIVKIARGKLVHAVTKFLELLLCHALILATR